MDEHILKTLWYGCIHRFISVNEVPQPSVELTHYHLEDFVFDFDTDVRQELADVWKIDDVERGGQ